MNGGYIRKYEDYIELIEIFEKILWNYSFCFYKDFDIYKVEINKLCRNTIVNYNINIYHFEETHKLMWILIFE